MDETNEILFLVQGSAPEPYCVRFLKNKSSLVALCTCPAGQNNTHCKHRLNILMGQSNGIVSNNQTDVEIIQKWSKGTATEKAIQSLLALEDEYATLKKSLSSAKKNLSKALNGEEI